MRRLRTSDSKWSGVGGAKLKNTIFPVTLYIFQKIGGGGGGGGGGGERALRACVGWIYEALETERGAASTSLYLTGVSRIIVLLNTNTGQKDLEFHFLPSRIFGYFEEASIFG